MEVIKMLAKKTYKNQITIPKDVIAKFPDAEYFDVRVRNNEILLIPVEITNLKSRLDKVKEKIKSLGITERDIEEAIRWARRGS
jgi:hypothetical protein